MKKESSLNDLTIGLISIDFQKAISEQELEVYWGNVLSTLCYTKKMPILQIFFPRHRWGIYSQLPTSPEPSIDDIEITNRLCKAGIILGITVLDHIIITTNDWLSFKQKGLM